MRPYTGSVLKRGVRCPLTVVLPGEDGPVGQAAHRGTAAHEHIRAWATDTSVDSSKTQGHEDFLGKIRMDQLNKYAGLPHEAMYVLRPFDYSAELIGYNLDRAYPELDPYTEIGLTIDVCCPTTRLVADYKTGRNEPDPPQLHGQLLTAALAASWADGVEGDWTVEFVYIRPTGYVEVHSGEVSELDLEDWAQQLQNLLTTSKGLEQIFLSDNPDKVWDTALPGDHCRYCPAKKGCVAYQQQAQRGRKKA